MPRLEKPIRVEGDVAYVPLTNGYEAVIDASDVPLVSPFNWTAAKSKHFVRAITNIQLPHGRRKTGYMHRIILGATGGLVVDHKDGDELNNRRSNLRVATFAQNAQNARTRSDNSSGTRGVCIHKQSGRWWARISANGHRLHLGLFDDFEAASQAYAKASAELHGQFGRTK